MRSTACSISDNGKVVGRSCISSDNETNRRACLFDPTGGGTNIYLGGLGGVGSTAYSINSNDLIVGAVNLYRAPLSDDPLISHACIFDSSGGRDNIDLGALGLGGSCTSSSTTTARLSAMLTILPVNRPPPLIFVLTTGPAFLTLRVREII